MQDSSSLFYSLLLCLSESLMNMDRPESERFGLPVVSLRCFSLRSYNTLIFRIEFAVLN